MTSRLLSVCNSFTPAEVRETAIASIKEMLYLWPQDMIAILLQIIYRSHSTAADLDAIGLGPFFPRRGHALTLQLGAAAKSIRPPRAMLQMNIPSKTLETHFGQDHVRLAATLPPLKISSFKGSFLFLTGLRLCSYPVFQKLSPFD